MTLTALPFGQKIVVFNEGYLLRTKNSFELQTGFVKNGEV